MIRADDIDMTGVITDQIVQHVIESPLVIADLTDHNANVFYELAIRHMHGKPYVQMILKGQRAPFDVSGVRTVRYSHLDLDEAEAARKDLINKIKAVDGVAEVGNPIWDAIDKKVLEKSDKPESRQLAAVSSQLDRLTWLIEQRTFPSSLTGYVDPDNSIGLASIREHMTAVLKKLAQMKGMSTEESRDLDHRFRQIRNMLGDSKANDGDEDGAGVGVPG